ncbi:hypothetical protein L1987_69710 [Smallanthus sonchifolius]|uniref:Uncharacterized protein n=1 Tax=Smallanthus sonchifolius TaxID=185202 RepID=A0ACB9B5P3_9ASTR|nr:hypothetical protein L1987_69710 [Smallanthus sonchifolius]
MAVYCNFNSTDLSSLTLTKCPKFNHRSSSLFPQVLSVHKSSPFVVRSIATSSDSNGDGVASPETQSIKKRLSEQSSWEAKDAEGNDYLYRLGKESDNMNIAVGARAGVIDDLFTGDFLGKDSDIVFDYRQKVTRSFEYLQGDYYIAPAFMDKVVVHVVKNYIAHLLNTNVPLILGIWGGKGQGKTFQTELIFQAMGILPVIMSAGELESERAGEPGRLIRDRYRTASQVVQNQGKMSCLMVNDIDAGLGRFGELQQPTMDDIINIVNRMYEKDGLSKNDVESIVKTFPNQALDFYGALRSRTYDSAILKWVNDIGGPETVGSKLLKRKKDENLPVFVPPKQTVESLLESGYSLIKEQQLIMENKLSKEYMKNMDD